MMQHNDFTTTLCSKMTSLYNVARFLNYFPLVVVAKDVIHQKSFKFYFVKY